MYMYTYMCVRVCVRVCVCMCAYVCVVSVCVSVCYLDMFRLIDTLLDDPVVRLMPLKRTLPPREYRKVKLTTA